MIDNLAPPALQAPLPTYPLVEQLIRAVDIYGSANGLLVYDGFVQQYAGSLTFRDREECYLYEANGINLGPAIYDCRLVGIFNNKPLYATTCCPGGIVPSSVSPSASSSSSGHG